MFTKWKEIANKPLKFLDFLITFILIALTIFFICYWPYIPEQVPQHWNSLGQIDDYADSGSYIMLLIMMYFFYAWHMISKIFPAFIQKDNLFGKENAARVTEQHVNKYIRTLLLMLWICDLTIQAVFAYIIVSGVLLRNLGVWFLPTVFLLLSLDFIWFFSSILRQKRECLT